MLRNICGFVKWNLREMDYDWKNIKKLIWFLYFLAFKFSKNT